MTIGSQTSAFNLTRRLLALAGVLALTLAIAGCGDSEADQRKAFITFLEENNHRLGVHFLRPKPEEEKAFGDYLRHFTIILEFNRDLKTAGDEYAEEMKKLGAGPGNEMRSFEQMIARRPLMPTAKDAAVKFMQTIEARLAKLNAERAKLQQPDDLKAVYNTTYNKIITAPTQTMIATQKALIDLTDSSMRLVDYVTGHPGKVSVSGTQFRSGDAKTLTELNEILKAHKEYGRRVQDAQRNSQRVLDGS